MVLLKDKRILICGVLSNRSIAYGIAKACYQQGAQLAFTYQTERFKDRLLKLAADFESDLVFPCDVAYDSEIEQLFEQLSQHWPQFDGLVHAIAFAPREAISGSFLSGSSRESFRTAHEISAYSLAAMAKAARPYLNPTTAAILTLSYLGAQRCVPNYNMMGLAKASLEASVRYLAFDLGGQNTRVNAISAGPIRTLAASGIAGFSKILEQVASTSALKRNVNLEDIGNAAVFLLSNLSSGVTGETLYVDAGYHHTTASA